MMSHLTSHDIKKSVWWEGRPIEELPNSKLIEIIEELIEQRDYLRHVDHERRLSLFPPKPSTGAGNE